MKGQHDEAATSTQSPLKDKVKEYYIGGVQMKISDIKHIHHADYKPDKPKKKGKGQKEESKRSRKQSPPHMFGGMSPMAHDTFMEQKKDMTSFEIGVSDTKIIIPSFKTTSKLFAQHFQILRELNHKL